MPLQHPKQVQDFVDFLHFQKRYSSHTVLSYTNDLFSFFSFLAKEYPDTEVHQVKTSYIRTWLADMKENEMSSRSLNRKISSLRSFYKYLLKNGIIQSNPVSAVISPKMPKRLPQFVAESDTEKLFTVVEYAEGLQGLTEKLVLQVLYFTGMRKAELISLKDANIDQMNAQIKVMGKGNKERVIPVNNTLVNDLKYYVAEKKRLLPNNESGILFISDNGVRLDPKHIYNIVKKYLSKVTTISKKSPHVLRHSFATHLMNNGADLNAVKELLGHSSLAATQIYTHNSIEKLKDVYKKAHPKA
ncbi:MAG: tyrosine-type recombinase/integrase [Ferruginibacter sp.]